MARRCVDYLDDIDYLNFSSFQRWCTSHASPPRYSYPSFYSDAMHSVHSNKFDVFSGGYYQTPYWLLQHLATSGNESFYLSKRSDKRYHNSWYNPDGFHYKESRYYQHRRLDENYKVDRGSNYDHMAYDERRCFARCNRNGAIYRNKQKNEESLSSRSARNPDITGNICDGNTDTNNLNNLHDSRVLSSDFSKSKDSDKQNDQSSNNHSSSTISEDKSKPSEDEEKDSTNSLNSHASENTIKTSSPKYNDGYASWYMSEEQQQIVDTLREVNMRHERQLRRDIQAAKEGRPRSDDSSSSYNEMNISDTQHRSSSSDEDECITLLLSSADVAPICDPLNEEDVERIRNDYLEKSSSDYFEDFQSIFTVSPEKKIINTLTKVCMKEEYSTENETFEDIHDNKRISKNVIKQNVECVEENSKKPLTKVNDEDEVVSSSYNEVSEDTNTKKLNECKNEETLSPVSSLPSYSRSSSPYNDTINKCKDDSKCEDARNGKSEDSCEELLSNSHHPLPEKKSSRSDDVPEIIDSCITNNLDDEKPQNELIKQANLAEQEYQLPKQNFQLSSQISEFPRQRILYIRNEDKKDKEIEVKDFNNPITPTDVESSTSVQRAMKDTCNFKYKELPNELRNEEKDIKASTMRKRNCGMRSEILNTSSLNMVKNSYESNGSLDYYMFMHSSKIDASHSIQTQDNKNGKSDSCLINPKFNHKCTFQQTGMCSLSDSFLSTAQDVQTYKRISVEDIFQIQTNAENSDALKKLLNVPAFDNSPKISSKSTISYISPTTHLKMLLGIGQHSSLPSSDHQEIAKCEKAISSQDYQPPSLTKTSTSSRFETSFPHSKGDGNCKHTVTKNLSACSDQTSIRNLSESSSSFLSNTCIFQKDYKIQEAMQKEGKTPSSRNDSHITRNYYSNENLNRRNRRLTTKTFYYNNNYSKSDKMKNQSKDFTAASKEEINAKRKIYPEKKSFKGSYYLKSNETVKPFSQYETTENQRKQRKKRNKKEKGTKNNQCSDHAEFSKAKHEENCKDKSVETESNMLKREKDITPESHTKHTISDSHRSKNSNSRKSFAFLNNSTKRSLVNSEVENVNISSHCVRSHEFQSLDSKFLKAKQNELIENNKQQNGPSPVINKVKNHNTENIDDISNVRGNFCHPSLQSNELKFNKKTDNPSPKFKIQTIESKTDLKSNGFSLDTETISSERPNNLRHVSRHDCCSSKGNIGVNIRRETHNKAKTFDSRKQEEIIASEECERIFEPSEYKPESRNKSSESKKMNSIMKQQTDKNITFEKMSTNNVSSSLGYNMSSLYRIIRENSYNLDIDVTNSRISCTSTDREKENEKKTLKNVSKFTTENLLNPYNVNNQTLSLNTKSQNKYPCKENRFLLFGKYDDKIAFNRNLFNTYSIRNLRDPIFTKLALNPTRIFIPKLTIFPLIMKDFFLPERYVYDTNGANIFENEPILPTNFAGKLYFDKNILQYLMKTQKKMKRSLRFRSVCERTLMLLDSERCLKGAECIELPRSNSSVMNYSKNETILLCTLCYKLATSTLKPKTCPRIFIVESDIFETPDFLKLQGDILCKLLPCERRTLSDPHKSSFVESHVLHISPLSLKTLSTLAANQKHSSQENVAKASANYMKNKSMCASKDEIGDVCLIPKLGEKMEEKHEILDISPPSTVIPRCIPFVK